MPTTSETILEALRAAIDAGAPTGARVLRNAVLPEAIPAAGLMILRDGDPGEPEQLMSPHRYVYEHRVEVDLVVEGPAADARFDALKAALGGALAADRTLGGLCDWTEAEAPEPIDLPVEGADQLKAATVIVVLHYDTSDPLL